ncbi:MAG TPA: imidazolonepropionase [Candidatus Dormibacteraeota bacterium]|nr:imidazolonepropionase [Candidatus Dormibacteraeota bacterium]
MSAGNLVVRGIGQLVTCDPAQGDAPGVLTAAALVARDGILTYVGPESGLPPDDGAIEVDAGGAAVLPGFVDSHTHAVWMGDRSDEYAARAAGASYEAIAAQGGGIRSTVRATGAATVDELVAAARPRVARMLAGGTTTAEVKSGYGLDLAAELRQLEAARQLGAEPGSPDIFTTYLALHASPPGDRAAFIDAVVGEGLAAVTGRARFADCFCETGAYSVAECERFLLAARAAGLRLKIHTEQLTRTGGAALAARLGAVSADHLERATDDDLRALATAGVVGVILPGAALTLGGPPPPGRRLVDAGAVVAIATDCNPGTSNTESMPLMASLAVALAGLTPAEAVVAATTGGATALGLEDRGVVRAGARCDLAVMASAHWLDVAYHLGGGPIAATIVRGEVVAGSL